MPAMNCPLCGSDRIEIPTVDNGVGMQQVGPATCVDCGAWQSSDGEWEQPSNRLCKESELMYAEFIDAAVRKPLQEFRPSVLGHQEAFEELAQVWEECRHPGWDGYTADAVEQEAFRSAYVLIESLPLGFPRPSISAQPDGQLTFEWYRAPTRTLSLSIDPDGFIHYAGLFGSEKHFGTVPYLDGLPDRLLRLASEV